MFRRLLLTTFVSLSTMALAVPPDSLKLVDPFIGTMGDGAIYPGVTLPFSFIQVSPDTTSGGAGGYLFDKKITGFSQQHISGMGGPILGEIALLPMTGTLENPSSLVSPGKSAESASPGYYTVTLEPWNVKVELTATRHVALHQETFPASDESRILVNVGHCLFGRGASWGSAKAIGGEVKIDPAAREISGFMAYQGGRGNRKWKVWFAARFDTEFNSFGTWDDAGKLTDGSLAGIGSEIGAYLNFKTTANQVVRSKVAVSWRSVEQARSYFATEMPGWDFEKARENAETVWAEALDKIQVEGGTEDQRKQLSTAFYRMHVTPNDWTGEAPQRYGDRTYYENILCMWDTFRTVNPLLTLIEPKVNADIINTILSYYSVDGWTGDAHSAHDYEHVQNGSHADSIIADAYVKNLPGVDWKLAYEAIRKNAFVDQNPDANNRPSKGRFRLDDYRKHHFLPTDITIPADKKEYKGVQAVSRTLEYVYNDFCVLTLAKKFGSPADVADLTERLGWYKNLWDPNSGFMRGKKMDGTFLEPFDPEKTESDRQYYEGHAWTWSWYVPHDAQGLIELNGGIEPFVDKLTIACDKYYQAFNEPCMLQTFLFIHAGRPDKTQFYIRKALANFTSAKNGLPGNDDSGTTSSWLIWAMLGIYPNAGQDFYYIGSPTFTKATMKLGNGKQIVINAPGASTDNKYIASVRLNGQPWNQAWFRHEDVINGAVFDFEMVSAPTKWGTLVLPPSLSAVPVKAP